MVVDRKLSDFIAKADSSADDDAAEIVGKSVGSLTHQIIGACARRFGCRASSREVLTTAEDLRLAGAVNHRQALKMNSVSLAAAYFRDFSFESADFLGAEVWVGAAPVDLVWESKGLIWIDEIKTGSGAAAMARRALDLQVRGHWAGGSNDFGEKFGGVRAVLLESEKSSFHLDASGVETVGVPR